METLQLDYTNILSDAVGSQGLSLDDLAALAGSSSEALAAVQARRSTDLRWLDLPYREEEQRRPHAHHLGGQQQLLRLAFQ